jgi:hypothetical protein
MVGRRFGSWEEEDFRHKNIGPATEAEGDLAK